MSVITVCTDTDEGAFVNVSAKYDGGKVVGYTFGEAGPNRVLRESYVGLVLATGENNGYDDSDFTATVWNAEKGAPETFVYASTRGWSYDLYGAGVDATPEVRAAYAAYQERKRRLGEVSRRRAVVRQRLTVATELGVTPAAIRRLEAAYGSLNSTPVHRRDYYERTYAKGGMRHEAALAISYGFRRLPTKLDNVLDLAKSAKSGRLRNEFKKKLGAQVLDWLNDPAPRYSTPLSTKQAQYV